MIVRHEKQNMATPIVWIFEIREDEDCEGSAIESVHKSKDGAIAAALNHFKTVSQNEAEILASRKEEEGDVSWHDGCYNFYVTRWSVDK